RSRRGPQRVLSGASPVVERADPSPAGGRSVSGGSSPRAGRPPRDPLATGGLRRPIVTRVCAILRPSYPFAASIAALTRGNAPPPEWTRARRALGWRRRNLAKDLCADGRGKGRGARR